MKKIIQSVVLILSLFNAMAQTQTDTLILNEAKALEIALANNNLIRNSMIELAIEEKKIASAIDLKQTQIGLDYGQINSGVNDYFLSISQDFEFPLVYVRNINKQQQHIGLQKQKMKLIDKQVRYETMRCYSDWLTSYYEFQNIQKERSQYKSFLQAIQLKYESGEIPYVAKLISESKFDELEISLNKSKTNVQLKENELKKILKTTQPLKPNSELLKKEFDAISEINQNTFINYLENKVEVENVAIKLERAKLLPALSVGYFNQRIDLTDGFSGWQFGISVPLFFWSQTSRINMAKLNQQLAENTLESERINLQLDIQNILAEIAQHTTELNYFEEKALKKAETILVQTEKSFNAGNIGYVEYLQGISVAYKIKREYYQTLNTLNKSIITYLYLTDKL
jgi:cobalt-zinc-cadmium resistance protein CzcA